MITNTIDNIRRYFPFEHPRENQLEIIQRIIIAFENHKYVILNAPTGVGKSPIAITVASFFDGLSSIITSEKILQDQYTNDFSHNFNIVSVKGVNAYTCPDDDIPVSEAICKLFGMKFCKTDICDYKAMIKQRSKKIWITNYSIALTNPYFILREHEFFVCDEMHKLESILLNNVACSLSIDFIKYIAKRFEKIRNDEKITISTSQLLTNYYKAKEINNPNNIREYINIFLDVCTIFYDLIVQTRSVLSKNYDIENLKLDENFKTNPKLKNLRYVWNTSLILENIYTKFRLLNDHIDNKKAVWIVEVSEKEIVLKPVYANFLFKYVLGNLADKILFMSATAHCKQLFCDDFDIDESEVYEISVDSPFPVENRKIYAVNYLSMSYTNVQNNLQPMTEFMDTILDSITCRSIVHSGNYAIAQYITENSQLKHRIIAPKSGEREHLFETEFKKRPNGILVSPSIIEGVSLDDDLCRVQIVVKVPYTSLADKRVQIKASQVPLWYSQEAIFKVVQSCGRSVRHKDDFCITFILDTGFSNLYLKTPFLIPQWFLKAIQYIDYKDVVPTLENFMYEKNIPIIPF